jgi:hypothetical protein
MIAASAPTRTLRFATADPSSITSDGRLVQWPAISAAFTTSGVVGDTRVSDFNGSNLSLVMINT